MALNRSIGLQGGLREVIHLMPVTEPGTDRDYIAEEISRQIIRSFRDGLMNRMWNVQAQLGSCHGKMVNTSRLPHRRQPSSSVPPPWTDCNQDCVNDNGCDGGAC